MGIKKSVRGIPIIGNMAAYLYSRLPRRYPGSQLYWEQRYMSGGDSGAGSKGRLARFKADVVNTFVRENSVESIIEFGCGDGSQLNLSAYPKYIGLDVSITAIKLSKAKFAHDKSKSFFLYDSLCFVDNNNIFQADLTLSLDVIYHLIEDNIFHEYMKALFRSSTRYVIIYSSNWDARQSFHQKPRQFTEWIKQYAWDWQLAQKIDNIYAYESSNPLDTSHSDFYIYRKVT